MIFSCCVHTAWCEIFLNCVYMRSLNNTDSAGSIKSGFRRMLSSCEPLVCLGTARYGFGQLGARGETNRKQTCRARAVQDSSAPTVSLRPLTWCCLPPSNFQVASLATQRDCIANFTKFASGKTSFVSTCIAAILLVSALPVALAAQALSRSTLTTSCFMSVRQAQRLRSYYG